MKISLHLELDFTKIWLESQTAAETVAIMQAVARVKKPVRTFGRIRDDGSAWCWILLPCNKRQSIGDVLKFGNE